MGYLLFSKELNKSTCFYNQVLWAGQFSVAQSNGSIVRFIQNYIRNKDVILIILTCDGEIHTTEIDVVLNANKLPTKKIIVGTLAQKTEDLLNYLYMPLDDNFFTNGVNFDQLPKWEDRSAVAFWRGGSSGGGLDGARCRTVAKLIDYYATDVKLIKNYGWENGKNIPDNFFKGDRVNYCEFLKYKIFFIIDGNCIASNHMWGFGTGCVPFIISNAKCWFLRFLTPFVNYIPIDYDLANLIEQIEWVRNNDADAKQIADNALQFSKEYFSAEFQQQYLMDEIDRLCD